VTALRDEEARKRETERQRLEREQRQFDLEDILAQAVRDQLRRECELAEEAEREAQRRRDEEERRRQQAAKALQRTARGR
jgi:hypothetical protein